MCQFFGPLYQTRAGTCFLAVASRAGKEKHLESGIWEIPQRHQRGRTLDGTVGCKRHSRSAAAKDNVNTSDLKVLKNYLK